MARANDIRNELLKELENVRQLRTTIETETQQVFSDIKSKSEDLLNQEKTQFTNLIQKKGDDFDVQTNNKLNEIDKSINGMVSNTESHINELIKTKDSLKTEINTLQGVFQDTISTVRSDGDKKNEQMLTEQRQKVDEKLKELLDLAENITTQNVLSKKAFALATESENKSRDAERWLFSTLIALVVCFVVLFFKNIFITNDLLNLSPGIVMFRLSLAIPLGLYAWLQAVKVKREMGLRDQYNHKGLTLSSYSAFFEFLSHNDAFSEKQQMDMTNSAFCQVLDNAADKADKYQLEQAKNKITMLEKTLAQIAKLKNIVPNTYIDVPKTNKQAEENITKEPTVVTQ